MTKEEAHELLAEYLEDNPPPIKDVWVTRDTLIHSMADGLLPPSIGGYTFRGLLQIAYDLKDS